MVNSAARVDVASLADPERVDVGPARLRLGVVRPALRGHDSSPNPTASAECFSATSCAASLRATRFLFRHSCISVTSVNFRLLGCPLTVSKKRNVWQGFVYLLRSGNDVLVVVENRRVPAGHQAEHALLFAGDKCPNGLGCNLKFGALTRDCDAEPDWTCGIGGGAVPEHTARNVDRLPVRGVDLEADGVSVATAGLGNAAMGCAAGRRPNNNKS